MGNSIESIEGIGPALGKKLKAAGVGSTTTLLKAGATPKGRKALAAKTGIADSTILRCVNMADLFRVKGVATQYAELLEASGVDTVKELKMRRADNLAEKMKKVSARKKITRVSPGEKTVAGWIAQAKKLKAVVRY